ncbi:DNA uptake protein ComE [Amycolatopsis xylanica]|uniref:DNA uptake protein ComE n=1 Tax=Amycolatopsis xylanica TaxID=589385 RepID=A0A1H3RHB0_9PSEU|nr:helix-hairpin-helix domain-containing protein [Amycolatopsis xylanica]SDZ25202.1 DNA uptake protein ComE [Amycolatopsis xylanica]
MTEVRLGLIEFGKALNDTVTVPGLGQLPGGQVSVGRATRGARARLVRNDRVLAEDLRLGIMLRKKFLSSELEPRTEAGFLRDVFVAVGRRDIVPGDALELYADNEIGPDTSSQVGVAQVHAPGHSFLTGFHAQVRQHEGTLRDGALIGHFRGGQVIGSPMRVLGLSGPAGPIPEVPAGQYATALLGFQCAAPPMPGDMLAVYPEADREYLEHREGIAVVHGVNLLGDGSAVAAVEVPEQMARNVLTAGSLARLIRPNGVGMETTSTVVRTGIKVTSLARGNMIIPAGSGTGVFTMGLSTQDVQANDVVETYVPAPGTRADQQLAPPPLPEAPSSPVDVNTAPPSDLAALPGMSPERAASAVELRQRQGGFADVEAFGVAVGLQPHEIVRLRGRATASRVEQRGTGIRQLDI